MSDRLFEMGDAGADELIRRTDDGATVAEPTLWQEGRPMTAAETDAAEVAAEQVAHHRATIAENSEHRVTITAVRNYVLAACPCGWGRQVFSIPTAQQFGRAHELNSADTPAELEAVRARHRAERARAQENLRRYAPDDPEQVRAMFRGLGWSVTE